MPERINEILIAGGGVAGGAAALLLAQRGHQVTLLEKEKKQHHKVCGEFISPAARRYLNGLGIVPGNADIQRLRLARGPAFIDTDLPFTAASLSRAALDRTLLQNAAKAGARICYGSNITHIAPGRNGWQIKRRGGEILYARTVFLATGKHDVRGWRRTAKDNAFIGFKRHYRVTAEHYNHLRNTIELHLFDGGYAGLAPLGERLVNLCLVVDRARFAACSAKWETFFPWLMQAAPLLDERLEGALPLGPRPLAVYGIPYGYLYRARGNEPQGLYRLGDQMAVIPSFAGDGIAIALYTAHKAAEHYTKTGHLPYHREAGRTLAPVIGKARLLSGLLNSQLTQAAAFSFCRMSPGLVRTLAGGVRLEVNE